MSDELKIRVRRLRESVAIEGVAAWLSARGAASADARRCIRGGDGLVSQRSKILTN